MLRLRLLGLIAAALLLFAAPASATVLTFDDLSGSGTLADGYGGINWGSNWQYYEDVQYPYTPASTPERIYSYVQNASFSFQQASYFSGAYISGADISAPVSFALYLNGTLVGTSGTLTPNDTPTFLASAYAGLVDTVMVLSSDSRFFVLDNLTYTTSAVPLPAALPLFGVALAGLGAVGRRMRRQRA